MARWNEIGKHGTQVLTEEGKTKVIYHGTPVVTLDGNKVTLRTRGYQTVTTKRRMNQAANQFDLGFSVYQKNWDWYVWLRETNQTLEFKEGMTFEV